MIDEKAFERLLRYYPKQWRDDFAEVFIATALDDARARGLKRPDGRLRLSAVANGLGMRLTLRAAMILSGLAIPLAYLYQGMYTSFLFYTLGIRDMMETAPYKAIVDGAELFVGNFLLPVLVMIAAVCLIAGKSAITPPRALAVAATFSVAALISSIMRAMWIIAARNGEEPPAPVLKEAADALWWVFILIAVCAVVLVVDQLLEARVPITPVRWALALLIGLPFGFMAAALSEIPFASLVFAIPIFLVSVMLRLRQWAGASAPDSAVSITGVRRVRVPMNARIAVTLLALIGLVMASLEMSFGFLPGIVDLVAEVTGKDSHPGALLSISYNDWAVISVFPMLIAWGICESAHRKGARLHIWGPIVLLMLSWAMVTAMMVSAFNSSQWVQWLYDVLRPVTGDPKGFGAIMLCFVPASTAAVVWLVDRHVPAIAWMRLLAAIAVATGWYFLSFFVVMGTPFFFSPALCIIVVIRVWTTRRRIRVSEGTEHHSPASGQ